jgi:hypothetical protein
MSSVKRKARRGQKQWSWKYTGLIAVLVNAFTLLLNSGHIVGYIHDKVTPERAPVRYAQILQSESLHVKDSVTVTVHRTQ